MTMTRWFTAILLAGLLWPALPARAQGDADEEPPAETARKPHSDAAAEHYQNPGIYAPTIGGLTGLFRTVSSDIGGGHTFRIGLHTEAFKSSGFLVEGDENSRFIGTLAASYAPWRYTEIFFNFRSAANNNDRTDPNRLDQPVILALGDLSFGAKGQYPITPYLGVGGNFAVNLLNSVGGVSFDGDSTGAYFGMLTSFDLDPLASFPLRFHLNFGFQLDNSGNLAVDDRGQSVFRGYSLASMQVEKFALGINPSRLQLRFAMDAPLRRFTKFGLTPILEIAADFATAEADPDFTSPTMRDAIRAMLQARLGRAPTTAEVDGEIDPTTTAWMTIGVRTNPVKGFNVELASDIGLVSPGYGYGPPVVPWNIIVGLSYAYDPVPPTRVVTKESVKTIVREEKRPFGKFRGRVVNARTMEPIEAAIVTMPGKDLTGLSTDPDGSFLSYELSPGQHPIMVRHPEYQVAKLQVEVKTGATTAQDIKLEPAAPRVVKVTGTVTDAKGAGVAATIAASGTETRQVTADASGHYTLELKPGSYTLAATADGYLRKEQLVSLAGGPGISADFSLSARPRRSLVTLTKNAIVIKKQVHFGTNTAAILPDSQQLLDSIVDVLLSNPNIKIEIAGHTDNRGRPEANMQLSQARAEAVRDYLVKNGVAESRLVAKGYGPTKPKVPNITPGQRARNRRVEFIIIEQ